MLVKVEEASAERAIFVEYLPVESLKYSRKTGGKKIMQQPEKGIISIEKTSYIYSDE